MEIKVDLGARAYPIYLERGILSHIGERVDLNRKVFVLTDDGVPQQYLKTVLDQCPKGYAETVRRGEGAKSFPVYEHLCARLLALGFTRRDLVISLGGGVVGDLGGFVAATYMRGIDFVGIPTTTLSQIDSSVGGKMAINLDGVKNIIGAFHQPRAVFIDGDTLATLPPRHYANGLAEALKMGLILDPEIVNLFEQPDYAAHVNEIIYRAVAAKARIVEIDETEQGARKSLNFGHTIGHGIESAAQLSGLLHGECVALGMLYFLTDPALVARVQAILRRLCLPTEVQIDREAVFAAMAHDKKGDGDKVTVVKVDRVGHYILEKMSYDALRALL
jgi:3-dehydroquinate synthase